MTERLIPTRQCHEQHSLADGGSTSMFHTVDAAEPNTERMGTLTILVCVKCAYIEAICDHVHNSWNEDGTQLTCDFCGADGT